jgi:hypothetical protein
MWYNDHCENSGISHKQSNMTIFLFLFAFLGTFFAPALPTPIDESIVDYTTCVAAGNPILESYPQQCQASDGRTFVAELEEEQLSDDACGDGVCAEFTCQAIGCPKAETPQSCPQDCAE